MKFILLLILLPPLAQADELFCLAQNIYFEARSENLAYAVADVVLNRVKSSRYASSICSVIRQRKQFSWYSDGKSDKPIWHSPAWETSYRVASSILFHKKFLGISGAHYHATYVDPQWGLRNLGQIGEHIFYAK